MKIGPVTKAWIIFCLTANLIIGILDLFDVLNK